MRSGFSPVTLTGAVVSGDGLGRKLGVPTANLACEGPLPPFGVYEARVTGAEFKDCVAICNVGRRPTVGGRQERVEVHIPGFSGDLYGQTLTVTLVRLLRRERKFASVDALVAQIRRDIKKVESRR